MSTLTAERPTDTLAPWRCSCCSRLLGRLQQVPGLILEIRCKSCKTVNTLRVTV